MRLRDALGQTPGHLIDRGAGQADHAVFSAHGGFRWLLLLAMALGPGLRGGGGGGISEELPD